MAQHPQARIPGGLGAALQGIDFSQRPRKGWKCNLLQFVPSG